jgi:hypothetical protein
MSVDGTTSAVGATEFWRNASSISVVPNTTYKFSFWLNSVYPTLPTGQSLNLDMVIDGNGTANPVPIIIVPTISQATLGSNSTWRQYSMTWVCPTGVSTVDLALRQVSSSAYRDFGVDDISFTCVSCEDFMTDINNYGIQSTLVSGNTYKYCVSSNVSPTDIVQWDMDCNGTIDATTNTPCNNFTLTSVNSQLCATVLHVIKAGDTCRAKVNICLPNIIPPKPCVCDSTFNNSVNAGFTWAKSTPYTVTFTPVSLLNNCDSVRWTASGIGGSIGNSLGTGSITYTFPSTPGTYQICMLVTRTTPNGTVCRREACISITLTGQVRASDIELLKLIVRPNPTTHSTSISVPEQLLNKKNTLRINSLEGRTMTATAVESLEMTLNLDTLPTGMYFLSLYDDKGNMLTRPTKFVKQ